MAKFKFRLQSYLELKEKIEDQKKLEYGKALQALDLEKEKKALYVAEENKKRIELKNSMKRILRPELYRSYKYYIDLIKEKIVLQDEYIEKAEIIAEEKRYELTEALKEKKALDKLREKKLEEYNKEQSLEEQKITDEIVSYKYNQKEK